MKGQMGAGPHVQRGTSTVEFAIVGITVFLVLFGAIEVSRIAFERTMMEEGVRRAARLGAVCPVNDPYIANAARFVERNWGVHFIPNLLSNSVTVTYLDANGTIVVDPAANFIALRFVRVTIADYVSPLDIPLLNLTYRPAPISSTQPVESLGVSPTEILPCLPAI